VNKEEQLRWQTSFAVPAAAAAFTALVCQIGQIVLFASGLEDRPGIEPLPDEYLSIDQNPGQFIAAGLARAIGVIALGVVFYYLFRLIRARGGAVPRWFVYLVFAGPILFAIGAVLGALDQVDKAEEFAGQEIIRGDRGDDVASDLSNDTSPLVYAPTFAGTIGVAFLFVMLPLRARAVGLLSPFMAILGVICGALLVLPLVPSPVMTAFWLGALGLLFLDKWPGGRGPAWESGEAEPWPSPAQRRGLLQRDEAADDDSPYAPADSNGSGAEAEAEAEPVPDRPASRKRRRKG
jgi:hypothetical protein